MKKNHKKNRITSVRVGETPTPERRCHNGGVTSEIVDRDASGNVLIRRYKALYECPLDVYFMQEAISPWEYQAGNKFRHAYFRAVLGIKIDDIGGGGKADPEMAFLTPIYSERLLTEAYEALSPKQKEIVINVCGHDYAAGSTPKLKTLHRGLEKLCDVWKISDLSNTIH